MDPATILLTASASWATVKKAIALGKDIHSTVKAVTEWASNVDDLKDSLEEQEKKTKDNPPKSDSMKALDIMSTRLKIQQWEEEIKHEFLYGSLREFGNLGHNKTSMDAYKLFLKLRKEIKVKKVKDIQIKRAKAIKLKRQITTASAIIFLVLITSAFIYGAIQLILSSPQMQ